MEEMFHEKVTDHVESREGASNRLRGSSKFDAPLVAPATIKRPDRKETSRANVSRIAVAAKLWPATFRVYFDRAARLSHSHQFAVNPDSGLIDRGT